MNVHIQIPYALDKNLGKAYNEAMRLIPEGDVACFLDYDVMLLTPDAGRIIHEYAARYPNAILTCFTNRIHPLNREQLYLHSPDDNPNIKDHILRAEEAKAHLYTVHRVTDHFSGFLTVIPKKIWQMCPFPENGQCLGVDTEWFKVLKSKGIPMLRMNGLYVFHQYRIMNGINNKDHLK